MVTTYRRHCLNTMQYTVGCVNIALCTYTVGNAEHFTVCIFGSISDCCRNVYNYDDFCYTVKPRNSLPTTKLYMSLRE